MTVSKLMSNFLGALVGIFIGSSLAAPSALAQVVTMDHDWKRVSGNTCCVIDVAQMPDGTIVGVGTDFNLYTRPSLEGSWTSIGGCCVHSVSVQPNGSLLGAGGANGQVYTKESLTAPWVRARNSHGIFSTEAYIGDSILGVGANGRLYVKDNIATNWNLAESGGKILGVTTTADNTVILGAGDDFAVYAKNQPDDQWSLVPESQSVRELAVFNDGTLVGVGRDNSLYTTSITKQSLVVNGIDVSKMKSLPGRWVNKCSAIGTCTLTVGEQFSVSTGLANNWSTELETSLSTTLSTTATASYEGAGAKAEASISSSVTTGLRTAMISAKATTSDETSGSSTQLACEYKVPKGKFGYFYVKEAKLGNQSASHTTCHFACSFETPKFLPGSREHANSCS